MFAPIRTTSLRGFSKAIGSDEKYYEPPFEVASLWMDQVHPADIGQRLPAAYNARSAKTIADALTLGTGKLAVDGVVLFASTATIRITRSSSNCIHAMNSLSRW